MAVSSRRPRGLSRRRSAALAVAVSAVAAGALVASSAIGFSLPGSFSGWSDQSFSGVFDTSGGNAVAAAHSYTTAATGSLSVNPSAGLLAGDRGGPLQLTATTQPQHGSLTVRPDGSFEYIPYAGFTGTDTFSYTVSNAVHLYTDHLPILGTFGGVNLNAGGYGSSMYPDPGHPGYFYGLEDRGPNVTAPDGNLVVPLTSYDPSIGLFHFVGDNAILVRKIPLTDAQGNPYSGLIPADRATSDEGVAADLTGNLLTNDPNGYDSEGLVALPDGSFWVSDEYGPYITHFDQWGHAIQRLSPLNGTLPVELRYRVANRGLEGLTVTPDGKELVALMQSSLQEPDINGANAKKLVPLRLVTYNLKTHALHEYLYLLHNPATNGGAVSELAALSDTTFLVDERDGCYPGDPGLNPPAEPGAAPTSCSTYAGGAFKQLFKIDISGATDIGPAEHVSDPAPSTTVTYNATQNSGGNAPLGLLINGKSIEDLVLADNKATATQTSDAQTLLQSNGIAPVSSAPFLDINGLLGSVNATYGFYSHDKVEGVSVLDGGKELVISNDSDFGIAGANDVNGTDKSSGYSLVAKLSPVTGQQDNGEYLAIDMSRVSTSTVAGGSGDAATGASTTAPGSTATGTVTIKVK
ncbi:MAG TPA: esterase-like activity of phytase family protein [Solirubrobacteraceae bacterium]|jgi:hypothetical protein|nr:esterase-like activity of phytase family protein [Solirubrobacteraceae bacterium]